MGMRPFTMSLATSVQAAAIGELGEDARHWLRGKDTDQWSVPWRGPQGPAQRILRDIAEGRAWIAWDGDLAVATITVGFEVPLAAPDTPVWPASALSEKALYVHRVIVRRVYAGRGLGAGLLDWATGFGLRTIGTPLLRIDVWTDNWALHDYYRRQGFTFVEFRSAEELPDYPSRALFERRTVPVSAGVLLIER
jgi:GNAT superfamily N-acetyltransferase